MIRTGAILLSAWTAAPFARRAHAAGRELLHILCSGPAGSIPDMVARAIGEHLPESLAERVLVDNRPGAAGQISVRALKAAPADGSTLLLAQGAVATVNPFLYAALGYDPVLDLRPVSLASEMSLAVAIGPGVPANVSTLSDFISWMRQHPAEANAGSPGIGTLPHLLEAMLFREEGVAWQHIAYAGGPPAVTDLLGGRLAALVLPEGLLRQHHVTGRLRVLATSGPTRSAYLPDVPSLAEQGHPKLVVKEWFGFFASQRTSRADIETVASALQRAIASTEVATIFAQSGMTPASSTPAALAARIASEQQYWQPVLRANGIHAD
ncbi:MAG: tripartite tricarboxylate transporter substrate-binding protein [Caldimonas sp.]